MENKAPIDDTGPVAIPKSVPPDPEARHRIRDGAEKAVLPLDKRRPLSQDELMEMARAVLLELGLCSCLMGYAMVCVNNAFWRDQFAATPLKRRILLLPHCLKSTEACQGEFEGEQFACAQCGACDLSALQAEAQSLGYRVVIAEGSPVVVKLLLEESFEAILGVACLDSLEKAFNKIKCLGVPNMASPLVHEGCENTQADIDELWRMMALATEGAQTRTRSYLPLLKKSVQLFDSPEFEEIFGDYLEPPEGSGVSVDPLRSVDAMTAEWLREGGKRLRPFITLAGYALAKFGDRYLYENETPDHILPLAVRRVAAAIEVFHKASLVHDDIEDNDPMRYGKATLHRRYSLPRALNAGDFMIGLGYRMVAAQQTALGAEMTTDILDALSRAHIRLSQGQGGEMVWSEDETRAMSTLDALAVYSAKTAPAFEVALYAGLRMAGFHMDPKTLSHFSRSLGVAYQIGDDLEEWQEHPIHGEMPGFDALSDRATLLRAFALEAAGEEDRQFLMSLSPGLNSSEAGEHLQALRAKYEELGVFEKARGLAWKFRRRAIEAADRVEDPQIRDLLLLLLDTILEG